MARLMALVGMLCAVVSSGCSATRVESIVHETEITLLLPEALRPVEEPAQRVTLLLASGLALVFPNAVVRRIEERVFLDHGADTPVLAVFEVSELRAIQLYRTRSHAIR